MKRTITLVLATAMVSSMLALVTVQTAVTQTSDDDGGYAQMRLFGDVFERVRADYVEEVTDQQLIEYAIQGMLSSLDPHSSYMDADELRDMTVQTRGQFGGLGIEVTMESGLVKVVSPIDGTPAFNAGIQAGDYITHLDGEAILGLSLNEAVDRMRGLVDTSIVLTIRREGLEAFDVSITRDVIRIESVRSALEGEVGYVRVTTFNERATSGIEMAIAEMRDQIGENLIGVVLDLRNNPGGLLDQAIGVSDLFLNQGEIVSTRGRQADDVQRFNAHPGDLADGLPLVVLINGGSASASEIVAGALQDHHRAIIMGTDSFGKGSVQTIIPLGEYGAMRLTTARYYTPSGRSIQSLGIEPDILVEQGTLALQEPAFDRREADLRGALINDNGDNESGDPTGADDGTEGGTDSAMTEDQAVSDYQLARALDLIRGLALFGNATTN